MKWRQLGDFWFGILFFSQDLMSKSGFNNSQMKQFHIHIHVYIYVDFFQNQDWQFSIEMLHAACYR